MWGARAGVAGASPWLGVRARAEARDSSSPALARTHCSLLTTHGAPGERNYHVFYHVLLGARLLSPPDPKQHRLLSRSACYAIPHVDDAEEHRLLVQAMVGT